MRSAVSGGPPPRQRWPPPTARALSAVPSLISGGLPLPPLHSIRFTVQFNLFAGSIVGLGGPEQVSRLASIQEKGQLGCFLLTEKQAGVLSGLIVETTADWDPSTQEFVLHTPSDKAAKNWISQGCVGDMGGGMGGGMVV